MSRKFQRTHGEHQYRGRKAGRGARLISKLHGGISASVTIKEIFERIGDSVCKKSEVIKKS